MAILGGFSMENFTSNIEQISQQVEEQADRVTLDYVQYYDKGYSFLYVNSQDMRPMMKSYDVVLVDESVPFEEIQVDDVIVFKRPVTYERLIISRVIEIMEDDPISLALVPCW